MNSPPKGTGFSTMTGLGMTTLVLRMGMTLRAISRETPHLRANPARSGPMTRTGLTSGRSMVVVGGVTSWTGVTSPEIEEADDRMRGGVMDPSIICRGIGVVDEDANRTCRRMLLPGMD